MPEITMPKLSDTMTEGTLVSWKKKKGEQVSAGDVLAEIETDKATMEWESSDDGTLTEIYIQEGGKVSVGDKIAFIAGEGEAAPETAPAKAQKSAANAEAPVKAVAKPEAPVKAVAPEPTAQSPAPVAETPAAIQSIRGEQPPLRDSHSQSETEESQARRGLEAGDRVKASPLARKVAADAGVNLQSVKGSGPGARIVEKDVLLAASGRKTAPVAPSAAQDTRIPLSSMRKTIADRLLQSKTTIPHFYLNIEIDASPLNKLRADANKALEAEGVKFTFNDFVLRAAVVAAIRVPKVNASFDGDAIIQYGNVNLAVAVAVDDGLITPVLRNAQSKSIREISTAVKDFAVRARAKKLKPEEYQGGTFTVSNLGSYGIDSFSAIINPPQAVILSVGALVKKPVVSEHGQIVVGHRMNIGMSCDHRVVDGAIGAQYLAELRRLLENPSLMLI